MSITSLKKPNALKPGDKIGIIAPSGPYNEKGLVRGIERLKSLGFEVECNLKKEDFDGYLAASDEKRILAINRMFSDEDIKGILCARGGYGALRIIPFLDRDLISNNPKFFMGYSDITALLLFFLKECQMVSFYGPMVAGDLGREEPSLYTERYLLEALTSTDPLKKIVDERIYLLRDGGVRRGKLVGGCFSLLIHSLGTFFEPDTKGCIIFLEDVNEDAYKIDRMLTHLKLAGKFEGVEGIIFGEMVKCNDLDTEKLKKIVDEVLGDLAVPIFANFPFGHVKDKVVIPLGIEAEIDSSSKTLKFLESATKDPTRICA